MTPSLKARPNDRKPEENPPPKKTEKEEKKRLSDWNVGKKTEQEEDNNFKPAFSPRFQTAADKIQRTTAISGQPHVKRKQIETFLAGLKYPLHFLDFETFSPAIPIFDGTRPYQQIPFQFSLHIVRKAGAKPEHRKFLAEGRNDPRAEFMRQLKSAVEPVGSILVFNAPFEKSRMKECAEILPEYKPWVAGGEAARWLTCCCRFVDSISTTQTSAAVLR